MALCSPAVNIHAWSHGERRRAAAPSHCCAPCPLCHVLGVCLNLGCCVAMGTAGWRGTRGASLLHRATSPRASFLHPAIDSLVCIPPVPCNNPARVPPALCHTCPTATLLTPCFYPIYLPSFLQHSGTMRTCILSVSLGPPPAEGCGDHGRCFLGSLNEYGRH